jgi:hypothetical protein
MPGKTDPEAENRGTPYKPSKRPDQYAQNADIKPPRKEDREREDKDNKTS